MEAKRVIVKFVDPLHCHDRSPGLALFYKSNWDTLALGHNPQVERQSRALGIEAEAGGSWENILYRLTSLQPPEGPLQVRVSRLGRFPKKGKKVPDTI